jgi:hypothetical protein
MNTLTPEQRQKHLRTIEKIEGMKRPEKWRAIKDFTLELHPSLVPIDKDFCEAVKELREASNKTASSESGDLRNTMKIPQYIYEAINKLDEDLMVEMSGSNRGAQELIGQQLYKAFPEYRVCRIY